jgi:hypothetical protein
VFKYTRHAILVAVAKFLFILPEFISRHGSIVGALHGVVICEIRFGRAIFVLLLLGRLYRVVSPIKKALRKHYAKASQRRN